MSHTSPFRLYRGPFSALFGADLTLAGFARRESKLAENLIAAKV
jgi:hypothetical protein